MSALALAGRIILTLIAVAIAVVVGWQLWSYYMVQPWTRDGRVKADVVQVAADVSGLVSRVLVVDNQRVTVGTPLFQIDEARFKLAVAQAEAALEGALASLDLAKRILERTLATDDLITSVQDKDTARAAADVEQADVDAARADLALAKLNLDRSTVRAKVGGIVTNLGLRPGQFVPAGEGVFALIDSDSFRIEGYFEETKLQRIHVGDPAIVRLMGSYTDMPGRVESVASGIADQSEAISPDLLGDVQPTFNWVRLAQRVPVRIKLDEVPEELHFASGRTASVFIGNSASYFVWPENWPSFGLGIGK